MKERNYCNEKKNIPLKAARVVFKYTIVSVPETLRRNGCNFVSRESVLAGGDILGSRRLEIGP